MRSSTVKLDEVNYRCVLFGTAWQQDWHHAMNLMTSMHQNEITKNQGACNAAISACRGIWTLGIHLLYGMQGMQLRAEVTSYSNAANAFLSSLENWHMSLHIFQELQCLGLEVDDFCESIALSTCRQKWRLVLQQLNAFRVLPNMVCLNAGISSFSEAKYWHRALGLMDEAQGTGLQIDVVTIGSLMKGVPKWTWSLNLLERMEQLRCDLNTITFNAAINACEEGGAWEVALAIMDDLTHSYLPLTMITWNSCINSCAKAEKWKVVLALLESMITAKFQPDAFTFNGALCAMGSPETWPMALHFMRCMQRQEIQVSLITYGALITCCEKAHQWQRALELLQGLKRLGKADVISYSAAISACEKARRASVALELLDEMRRVQVRTDDISCNAALSACEKSGYWQMGLNLLEQINALSPGSVSFNASISAMSSISAWSSAVALFHAMRRFQVQPDDVSYNAAITSCEGKHWWVGLHFFSSLQQQDPVSFGAMIAACAWRRSLMLLEQLEMQNWTSNRISHNAAVEACRGSSIWKATLALLKDMSSKQQHPDATSFFSTLLVLESCDQPRCATMVLRSLEQHMQYVFKI